MFAQYFFRFLFDKTSILESASNSIGIEAILGKPGRKLISWLIRFTQKFYDRAGSRDAARVEMKRLKCMLVTVLFRSHFRLLYSSPLLYRSETEPVFSCIFLLALSSISFIVRSMRLQTGSWRNTKHVANLRINFIFNYFHDQTRFFFAQ